MLIKLFFSTLILSLTLLFILSFKAKYSEDRAQQISTLTQLTKLPGLALSTGYLEHRISFYSDDSNTLYPKMKNYTKMDYVYAK